MDIYTKVIPSFTNFVFLFMIISAFGMCIGYYERILNNTVSVQEFYGKRFKKIWPFFAMLVALDLVVSRSFVSLIEGFADITLVFGLLPNCGNISVIGVGWFLGLIFVFYISFPFFCYLIVNKRRAWLSFFASICWNISCTYYFDVGRCSILYSGCFFFAGGLIYLYRDKLQVVATKYDCVLLGVVLFLGIYYMASSSAPVMLTLFSIVVIFALRSTYEDKNILNNTFTKVIAGISMEIYLCHMVIFRLLEKFRLVYLLGNGWLQYLLTVLFTIIGAIIFSIISKKLMASFAVKSKHFDLFLTHRN